MLRVVFFFFFHCKENFHSFFTSLPNCFVTYFTNIVLDLVIGSKLLNVIKFT